MTTTEKIQQYLNQTNPDLNEGALLLLKLSSNRIEYNNIMRFPYKYKDYIEQRLKKYLDFKLTNITHSEVKAMQKKVDATKKNFLEIRKGKRPDHDSLPDNIKALYIENLDIIHKMRQLHAKLCTITDDNTTCKDSERYPFLKELIKYDKLMRENWRKYDSFENDEPTKNNEIKETKQVSEKVIFLAAGRYAKKPNEPLKIQLLDWYKALEAPTRKLTEKLKKIGIL